MVNAFESNHSTTFSGETVSDADLQNPVDTLRRLESVESLQERRSLLYPSVFSTLDVSLSFRTRRRTVHPVFFYFISFSSIWFFYKPPSHVVKSWFLKSDRKVPPCLRPRSFPRTLRKSRLGGKHLLPVHRVTLLGVHTTLEPYFKIKWLFFVPTLYTFPRESLFHDRFTIK